MTNLLVFMEKAGIHFAHRGSTVKYDLFLCLTLYYGQISATAPKIVELYVEISLKFVAFVVRALRMLWLFENAD